MLDGNNKASLVKVDGTVKDWMTTDPLIALDVFKSIAVWVTATTPSVLTIQDVRDVDFEDSTYADIEEGEMLVVNSVRIVEAGRLVATVAAMAGETRRSMSLCNVTWSTLTNKVVIYPEELEIGLTSKLETVDMLQNQTLSVTRISKWGMWLVGCGEDVCNPFRLILSDEELPEFIGPEEGFVWPINENNNDDNIMLGMGVDFSVPVQLESSNDEKIKRKCLAIICASEDGRLIVSALGKEDEDLAEETHDDFEYSEEAETEHVTQDSQSFSKEQEENECPNHLAPDKPPPEGLSVEEVDRILSGSGEPEIDTEKFSEEDQEKIRTEREIKLLKQMRKKFNDDVSKHTTAFHTACKLVEATKMTEMRAIDLCMEARNAVHKHEENDVDLELQEKMNWIDRLRKRMLTIQQIAENFVWTVQKFGSTEEQLEYDVEGTMVMLKKERKHLRQSMTHLPWTTALTLSEINRRVNRLLAQFGEEQQKDDSAERMKDFFMWASPGPILTRPTEPFLTETDGNDTLWRRIAGPVRFVQPAIVAETITPPTETGTYVLQPAPDQHGIQLTPEDALETSSCAEEMSHCHEEEDTNQLELCTEEEIKQIIQRQSENRAREVKSVTEITAEGPSCSKEADQLARVLHEAVLLNGVSEIPQVTETREKLPAAPVPPTMEQFLKNIGQETVKVKKPDLATGPTSEPVAKPNPPKEPSVAKAHSPEPRRSELPKDQPKPQMPLHTPAAMQQHGVGSFQAAGFSAFGQPSQVGAMGVAPQLGSLQQDRVALSAPTSIGAGFGAFASGGNVFGALAQPQSGQPQNAFATMAQKQTSSAFGGMRSTGAFNISANQDNAKLFEMRK